MNARIQVRAVLLVCFALVEPAAGQQWPSKPIIIVTTGASEVVPRVLGEEISRTLGQPVVVEAHPGASGTIAAEYTARQPPDGYTFLNATSALMASATTFKVTYDIMRDFAPVSLLATAPFILVAHPSLPVHTVAELIALAKKRPGAINFSATAPGSSSNLTAELFKSTAHIDIVHVSYKTMEAALIDVLGGQVQLCMSAGPNAVSQVNAHRLRALAVSTPKRTVVLPDVPTFAELGFPKVALTAWFGLLAPANTPTPIVSRMHAELITAIRKPDVRDKFVKAAVEPVGNTPEEFRAYMKADLLRWAEAARVAGVAMKGRIGQ